jgi:hypothetical protein
MKTRLRHPSASIFPRALDVDAPKPSLQFAINGSLDWKDIDRDSFLPGKIYRVPAVQTALALRQAIWRKDDPRWHVCGIPDVLHTDNTHSMLGSQ